MNQKNTPIKNREQQFIPTACLESPKSIKSLATRKIMQYFSNKVFTNILNDTKLHNITQHAKNEILELNDQIQKSNMFSGIRFSTQNKQSFHWAKPYETVDQKIETIRNIINKATNNKFDKKIQSILSEIQNNFEYVMKIINLGYSENGLPNPKHEKKFNDNLKQVGGATEVRKIIKYELENFLQTDHFPTYINTLWTENKITEKESQTCMLFYENFLQYFLRITTYQNKPNYYRLAISKIILSRLEESLEEKDLVLFTTKALLQPSFASGKTKKDFEIDHLTPGKRSTLYKKADILLKPFNIALLRRGGSISTSIDQELNEPINVKQHYLQIDFSKISRKQRESTNQTTVQKNTNNNENIIIPNEEDIFQFYKEETSHIKPPQDYDTRKKITTNILTKLNTHPNMEKFEKICHILASKMILHNTSSSQMLTTHIPLKWLRGKVRKCIIKINEILNTYGYVMEKITYRKNYNNSTKYYCIPLTDEKESISSSKNFRKKILPYTQYKSFQKKQNTPSTHNINNILLALQELDDTVDDNYDDEL